MESQKKEEAAACFSRTRKGKKSSGEKKKKREWSYAMIRDRDPKEKTTIIPIRERGGGLTMERRKG